MRYHKKLLRTKLEQLSWKIVLQMIASELSRALHLKKNGGRKEVENCLLRAKELLGVLESSSKIPAEIGLKLLPIMKEFINYNYIPPKEFKCLYNKCMLLSKS